MTTLYGYVSNTGAPEYDDIMQSDLPTDEKVKQIQMRGQAYRDELDREKWLNYGRMGLGTAISAASMHPILNVPYVGTGLGGAMYELGQGMVEGDTLPDIAKRTGQGFLVGEGIGAIPYVGKYVNKLSGGKIGEGATNLANSLIENTGTIRPIRTLKHALAQDVKLGVNPFKTESAILYDSANPLHRRQADLINRYNPAPDNYHTWIRNADDIYTFEDTLKPPQFDPDFIGNNFDPSYSWDMAQDAIKNGEIEVFSSYPIEKGVFVTPSPMEAQAYAGSNKIYGKRVPLDDVAWIDAQQGQYAPIDKEYMEAALNRTQDEISKMTSQEFKDFEDLGLDYYSKYLQDSPVIKEGYGDIYFSGNNKGKDFTANFRHYPTLKEQLRTSKVVKRGSNYKDEKDRVYDYLENTKDGETFNYTIEDIKGKGKKYKKMKSNSYYLSHRKNKK